MPTLPRSLSALVTALVTPLAPALSAASTWPACWRQAVALPVALPVAPPIAQAAAGVALALGSLGAVPGALAHSPAAQGHPGARAVLVLESAIDSVQLYPGIARVQRSASVPAGARTVQWRCLPQGLDVRSLQVQADAQVRVGDVSVQLQERALAPDCAHPLQAQLRTAQDNLAQAQAQTQALELSHSYLRSVAGQPDVVADGAGAAATPKAAARPAASGLAGRIGPTTEALRQSAQHTLEQLHQARRREQDLALAVQALEAETERLGGDQAKVAHVSVTLASARVAPLQLVYQVRGPSWSPGYRAMLDSASAQVQLERQALVAQNTGEDWTDVALTLSTGQPLQAASGRLPRPWTLDVQPDTPPPQAMAAPAPAPTMAAGRGMMKRAAPGEALDAAAEAALPDFAVNVQEGAYATEFAVPQRISVPSGGQRITLTLDSQNLLVQLLTRTAPALEPNAYLVAQLPPLQGVWPAGPMTLWRDGASVGQSQFDPGSAEQARTGLAFGRDERVQVSASPWSEHSASAGLTGGRTARTLERRYQVHNRHPRSVALQVLDAVPVSLNAQISVESHYQPQPSETEWQHQRGTIAWMHTLDAGASAEFSVRHTLDYDKTLRLRERR